MKATILDLRRRMAGVLKALDRNESVTILHRGRTKAILSPVQSEALKRRALVEHEGFGMWKDRRDLKDVGAAVRRMRKGRFRAL